MYGIFLQSIGIGCRFQVYSVFYTIILARENARLNLLLRWLFRKHIALLSYFNWLWSNNNVAYRQNHLIELLDVVNFQCSNNLHVYSINKIVVILFYTNTYFPTIGCIWIYWSILQNVSLIVECTFTINHKVYYEKNVD